MRLEDINIYRIVHKDNVPPQYITALVVFDAPTQHDLKRNLLNPSF